MTKKWPFELDTQINLLRYGLMGIGKERMAFVEGGSKSSLMMFGFQQWSSGSNSWDTKVGVCVSIPSLGPGINEAFYPRDPRIFPHIYGTAITDDITCTLYNDFFSLLNCFPDWKSISRGVCLKPILLDFVFCSEDVHT